MIVLHLVLKTQDSTMKVHGTARRRIQPRKPTAKWLYYIWCRENTLSILFGTGNRTKLLCYMAMKGYSAFPKALRLESRRQINIISRIFVGLGVLSLCRDAVGVFYSLSWLGCHPNRRKDKAIDDYTLGITSGRSHRLCGKKRKRKGTHQHQRLHWCINTWSRH